MYKVIGADGREYGPVTGEQLRQWIAEGRANAQTRVQAEGTTEWKPLADFPELLGTTAAVPPTLGATPYAAPLPTTVPNYLAWAIVTTICCCLPLGIPAIVYAAQVNTKLAAGDIAGAQDSSRKAKMWCWIAFGLGIIGSIIGFLVSLAAQGFNSSSY